MCWWKISQGTIYFRMQIEFLVGIRKTAVDHLKISHLHILIFKLFFFFFRDEDILIWTVQENPFHFSRRSPRSKDIQLQIRKRILHDKLSIVACDKEKRFFKKCGRCHFLKFYSTKWNPIYWIWKRICLVSNSKINKKMWCTYESYSHSGSFCNYISILLFLYFDICSISSA